MNLNNRTILLSVFLTFISITNLIAQKNSDSILRNRIGLGINSVPYLFAAHNREVFPNYTLHYKHDLRILTFRTGISGNFIHYTDTLNTYKVFVMYNGGVEKRMNLVKHRFFIIYGVDLLFSYKQELDNEVKTSFYAAGLGPIIGLEAIFRIRKNYFSISSETGFFLLYQYSLNAKNDGVKTKDTRLISGFHRMIGLNFNFLF